MWYLVRNATKVNPSQMWSFASVPDELFYFKKIAEENGINRLRVISDLELPLWIRFNQPSKRELERCLH